MNWRHCADKAEQLSLLGRMLSSVVVVPLFDTDHERQRTLFAALCVSSILCSLSRVTRSPLCQDKLICVAHSCSPINPKTGHGRGLCNTHTPPSHHKHIAVCFQHAHLRRYVDIAPHQHPLHRARSRSQSSRLAHFTFDDLPPLRRCLSC